MPSHGSCGEASHDASGDHQSGLADSNDMVCPDDKRCEPSVPSWLMGADVQCCEACGFESLGDQRPEVNHHLNCAEHFLDLAGAPRV